MNRNQRLYLFTIRFAAIFSLLLGIGPQIAYADTALPIVDEQGVYLIEVYPLSHQLHVLKHEQGRGRHSFHAYACWRIQSGDRGLPPNGVVSLRMYQEIGLVE